MPSILPSAQPARESGPTRFRAFALSLPNASEGSHMGHADFRVAGRIFATLAYAAKGKGTLKLTTEQQAAFLAELPGIFESAPGGWGRMGMTLILLEAADDPTMLGALRTAHRNVAEKNDKPARAKPPRPAQR